MQQEGKKIDIRKSTCISEHLYIAFLQWSPSVNVQWLTKSVWMGVIVDSMVTCEWEERIEVLLFEESSESGNWIVSEFSWVPHFVCAMVNTMS